MLKNLGKYDDKKILLEDIFGDKYEGICIHNNIDYNEHEYGVSEESIQLSHIIFYKSIIKDIKIVNDFSNKYGKLEEVVVESGLDLIDEVFEELGRENEKASVVEVYRSHKPDIHLYSGVVEMIADLKAEGIKVGIITDGRPEGQRNKLDALGLDVDDVIITDELGGVQFRKPCDIAFRILVNRWRLNPADIVYVGDNPAKDFQAPQQLGMRSVYFVNQDGLYREEMDVSYPTVNSIENVQLCVKGMR